MLNSTTLHNFFHFFSFCTMKLLACLLFNCRAARDWPLICRRLILGEAMQSNAQLENAQIADLLRESQLRAQQNQNLVFFRSCNLR